MNDRQGVLDNVYTNIGRKLKLTAKLVLIFGILFGVIMGIIFFVKSSNISQSEVSYFLGGITDSISELYIKIGIFCIIVGTVFSIISSLKLYGVGALCDHFLSNDHLQPDQTYHNNEMTGRLNKFLTNSMQRTNEFTDQQK